MAVVESPALATAPREEGLHMILCPSMMCARFENLGSEVRELDAAGADVFHCDVMDGSFVPNFAMGLEDVRAIRDATEKPVDVHLMVERPSACVDLFIDAGADIVYIHPEAERFAVKTLARIRERGARAGIAINPDTSISTVEEMLNVCDCVMVMTVNPGFAGQRFIEFTADKVCRLAELKGRYGFTLTVDGACSPERVRELSAIGADGFVLGTSALFGKEKSYRECIASLRKLDARR